MNYMFVYFYSDRDGDVQPCTSALDMPEPIPLVEQNEPENVVEIEILERLLFIIY